MIRCADFNLGATLASGQLFRWRPDEEGYTVWIRGTPARLVQEGSRLSAWGVSSEQARHFFSLDSDFPAVARGIDADEVIHGALQKYWGLRIIRQDPWECTSSFLLSACNNIPRLTGMIERLCVRFGETVERQADPSGPENATRLGRPQVCYRFPKPEALANASERTLRNCGLGFRAPYLKQAAAMIASGRVDLMGMSRLEDDPLRDELCRLPGVGVKVAECVMLFAYGRDGAFPVDVWIARAMRRWYFRGRKVNEKKIRAFARRRFGPQCGWAQQYLYCLARGSPS